MRLTTTSANERRGLSVGVNGARAPTRAVQGGESFETAAGLDAGGIASRSREKGWFSLGSKSIPDSAGVAAGVWPAAGAETGIDAVFGQLSAIIYTASMDGTWQRLRICRNDVCRWAFYDASKNRSGVWCSMAVCGSRIKARSWRKRHSG